METKWKTAIQQDVDAAIASTFTWRQFLTALERQGYVIRLNRKYITLRPPGKERDVRFKTLGPRYTPEAIQKRILEPKAFVHNKSKVNLVRYADDFIVTAATKEIAEEAKGIIRDFLQTRGLELSEEKTVITHINDGFDMLGWTFRKFKGKLIVKPSKKALKAMKASLSETILGRGKAWKQEVLIGVLNRQIRGWANYHQSVCASEAFAHIDYILYELLWRWAKRRHPHKGQWWVSTNYWHRRGSRNWVFSTENKVLQRVDSIGQNKKAYKSHPF